MKKYIIEVEVDEDTLKKFKCEGMPEDDINNMSVEQLIYEEMGWVKESGIYTVNITEKQEE